jgi:hypothetical protein
MTWFVMSVLAWFAAVAGAQGVSIFTPFTSDPKHVLEGS